jgi:WD40 repeat protein
MASTVRERVFWFYINKEDFSSHPAVFGAAAASGTLLITDLRASSGTASLVESFFPSSSSSKSLQFRVKVHTADCNSLAFHPMNEYAILTGSDDATIALWDMRNLSKEVRRFEQHHGDSVLQVQWNPIVPSIFASSSADQHVFVWDLKSKDGVIFDHKGHDSRIPDISWHPTRPIIASVAEDSSFQIWEASAVERSINSI